MDKLFALGFIQSADARLVPPHNNNWDLAFLRNDGARNILYAFVFHRGEPDPALWHVRYIGHTRKTFGGRMLGYQQGHGTGVNNRIHNAVQAHLAAGGQVLVFVMPDHFGIKIFDLAVDTAAGLEYSLIAYYAANNHALGHPPLFNLMGNPHPALAPEGNLAQEAVEEMQAEEGDYVAPVAVGGALQPPALPQFDYELGQTYWNLPCINVPVAHQAHFGAEGTPLAAELELDNGHWRPIACQVNRRANPNGSPRLYFTGEDGATFQNWKQAHFEQGDTIIVSILAPNHIRLSLN
jgi:hypothetical protein